MKQVPILLIALFAPIFVSQAETYGFRRDGTGNFPEATPPTTWSADKNVVWKTPLPAPSEASPILVGGKIFVTAEMDSLICVNAADGKILWQKAANGYDDVAPADQLKKDQAKAIELKNDGKSAEGEYWKLNAQLTKLREEEKALKAKLKDKPDDPALKQALEENNKQVTPLAKSVAEKQATQHQIQEELDNLWVVTKFDIPGYSTPTPVSDGKNVYAMYGTGVAVCYDLDGNRKWIRFVQKSNHHHGLRICPMLFDGKLAVCGNTNLFALNAADGKDVWKIACIGGMPMFVQSQIGSETVLVLPYSGMVRGSDGKTLFKSGNGNAFTAPVVQDGVIYYTSGGAPGSAWAVKLPTQMPETAMSGEILWKSPLPNGYSRFASPVVAGGLVYTSDTNGKLTVLDAKTGVTVYERTLLDGKADFYGSLTLAGKYIYASSAGKTIVFEAGKEYKEVARNELDTFRAAPIFKGKRMVVRTDKFLYCIGE